MTLQNAKDWQTRLEQNGGHFPDDIFKWILFNENVWISFKISLNSVLKFRINNIPLLDQVMAWSRNYFTRSNTKQIHHLDTVSQIYHNPILRFKYGSWYILFGTILLKMILVFTSCGLIEGHILYDGQKLYLHIQFKRLLFVLHNRFRPRRNHLKHYKFAKKNTRFEKHCESFLLSKIYTS